MPLIHKHLTEFDALNDHEEVTRQNRVEAHIKTQQQFIYPVIPVDPSNSPTNCDITLAHSQRVMDYNEKVHQWHDTSAYTQQHTPSPALASSFIANDQRQEKPPSASQHRYRKTRKKHQHQRSKYKPSQRKSISKQKQQEQHDIRPKKIGMHLLEKFTSPNIEIDHITVRHHSKPRVGLFNKGKTSARGKGVEDLVFSEASFLGHTPLEQHSSPSVVGKTTIINDTSTENINTESLSRPSPTPLKDTQDPLSEQVSCASDDIYDFFEYTKKEPGQVMKQPTISTIHTQQHLHDSVAHTTNSTSSYRQHFSQSPTQSLGKTVLIEPDTLPYDTGQHNAYGTSEYQDFEMSGNQQQHMQVPHYTTGITPMDTATATARFNNQNTYNYATVSYDGRASEISDNNNSVRYGSIGSETLHAWDSTSMINDPHHFRNQRNIHLQLHTDDPSLQPLTNQGIFKLAGLPVPFRPTTVHRQPQHPLYTDTAHSSLTASEQVLPRLPPMKPIYNINTEATHYDLHDPLGQSSNVISISSGSGVTTTTNNNKENDDNNHLIDRTYRWRPNYQLNSAELLPPPPQQQRNFYHDQYQRYLGLLSQQSTPCHTTTYHGDAGLNVLSPSPSSTHRPIVRPLYSPSSSTFWSKHTSY